MTALVFLLLIFILIVLILKKSKGQSDRSGFAGQSVQSKGEVAENDIVFCLERQIDAGLCGMIMQNLYIPKGDNRTAEIDVLFLSTKGIFVIESKNYAGYIFGNDQQKYWTVSLYAGGGRTEKHRFYNPVWQNRTHIKYLRRLLDTSIPVNSIVVFSERGEIKDISYYADDVTILQSNAVDEYFYDVRSSWPDRITEEKLKDIQAQLLPFTETDEEKRQEHIRRIIEERDNPQTCPWCGGRLVIRTAKRGASAGNQFYGCSNYPKCKYTRNV